MAITWVLNSWLPAPAPPVLNSEGGWDDAGVSTVGGLLNRSAAGGLNGFTAPTADSSFGFWNSDEEEEEAAVSVFLNSSPAEGPAGEEANGLEGAAAAVVVVPDAVGSLNGLSSGFPPPRVPPKGFLKEEEAEEEAAEAVVVSGRETVESSEPMAAVVVGVVVAAAGVGAVVAEKENDGLAGPSREKPGETIERLGTRICEQTRFSVPPEGAGGCPPEKMLDAPPGAVKNPAPGREKPGAPAAAGAALGVPAAVAAAAADGIGGIPKSPLGAIWSWSRPDTGGRRKLTLKNMHFLFMNTVVCYDCGVRQSAQSANDGKGDWKVCLPTPRTKCSVIFSQTAHPS